MRERSWDADWALCQAATPGPWEYDGMHNEIVSPRGNKYWLIVSECRSAPDQEYVEDGFGHHYDANFAFIAEARSALPYWLERVKELEETLRVAYEALTNGMADVPADKRHPLCAELRAEAKRRIREVLGLGEAS